MKSVILFALFVAAAVAAPLDSDKVAETLKFTNDNIGVGPFAYGFETNNGIAAQAQGELTAAGTPDEAISVRGQYSYVAPDGITYLVTYVADKNGFQPSGAHLPQ